SADTLGRTGAASGRGVAVLESRPGEAGTPTGCATASADTGCGTREAAGLGATGGGGGVAAARLAPGTGGGRGAGAGATGAKGPTEDPSDAAAATEAADLGG